MLQAKGQLVNLVTVGKQTKFENLNVFHQDKHIGDRIRQILRSGSCFILIYSDKNTHLKMYPEST